MERIHELRERIDKIDKEILELLEERLSLVKEIGETKKELDIPITDSDREQVVLARSGEFKEIFEKIIEKSKEEEDV